MSHIEKANIDEYYPLVHGSQIHSLKWKNIIFVKNGMCELSENI